MPKKSGGGELTPHNELASTWRRLLPNLYDLIMSSDGELHSIRFYQRGVEDILGVAKRFGSAGDVEVLFGSSFDLIGSLLSLEGAMSSNRWRVDRPYKERKAPS